MKLDKRFLWLILAAVVLLVPQLSSFFKATTASTILNISTMVCFFILLTSAWNIIGGLAGEINFFHPLFIGAGAYTSSILLMNYGISPWIGMVAGAILGALIGVICGWICYRAKLPHLPFALAALGFSHMGQYLAAALDVTGGMVGLILRPEPGLINMYFVDRIGYYYMALMLAIVAVGISLWITRPRLGYYLAAIKTNLSAAEAVGINTVGYRLMAMAISAALCAIGGTFYAQYTLYIDPHTAVSVTTVIEMILFCAIGGFGTVWGPVVGVAILMPIGEFLRMQLAFLPGIQLVVYGIVVVVVILLAPRGLVPWFQDYIARRRDRQSAQV